MDDFDTFEKDATVENGGFARDLVRAVRGRVHFLTKKCGSSEKDATVENDGFSGGEVKAVQGRVHFLTKNSGSSGKKQLRTTKSLTDDSPWWEIEITDCETGNKKIMRMFSISKMMEIVERKYGKST